MPIFAVTVADRHSGQSKVIAIDARDAMHAEAIAADNGWMVGKAVPIDDVPRLEVSGVVPEPPQAPPTMAEDVAAIRAELAALRAAKLIATPRTTIAEGILLVVWYVVVAWVCVMVVGLVIAALISILDLLVNGY